MNCNKTDKNRGVGENFAYWTATCATIAPLPLSW